MKKQKRFIIIIISAAVILMIASVTGVTIAFFTAQQQAYNDVTVGENTIEIVEDFDPPEKQKQDNEYIKSVAIRNTGNIPCYIRARLEFSSSDIMKLSKLSADGTNYVDAKDYSTQIESLTNNKWKYKNDGYYYYTEKVEAENSTSLLLHSVKTNYDNAAEIQRYDIIVYAESVQIYGKDGNIYDYESAWKHFN